MQLAFQYNILIAAMVRFGGVLLLVLQMALVPVHGWADIAGALTLKGTHHVFQGCPAFGGWHHAASTDLVHWEDRGVPIKVLDESYEGFSSNSTPCSGFVTVDDEGIACAGFRQCDSVVRVSLSFIAS
jgi:hypothetical protein